MAIHYVVFGEGDYRVLCLAADTKPTAVNGITLVETDTGKFYLRTAGAWVEQLNTSYAVPGDLTAHVAASDPHSVYQKESEKGAANGYAGLDGAGLVPVAQLPGLPTAWGAITGVLATQTDLQSALDAKQASDAQLTSLAALDYTGNTLKVIRVNAGETDFELATISGGSGLTHPQVLARTMGA